MTENEALIILKQLEKYEDEVDFNYEDAVEAVKMATKTLEELQMYKQGGLCLVPSDVYRKQCEELDSYKEIGTIDEFKVLKEKEELFDRNIKMFNSIGLKIRNDAIDEFVEKITLPLTEDDIHRITEEMKGVDK